MSNETDTVIKAVELLRNDVKESLGDTTKELVSVGKKIVRIETRLDIFGKDLTETKEVVSKIRDSRADATARIDLAEKRLDKISDSYKTIKKSYPPRKTADNFQSMAKFAGLIITAFVTGVGALFGILYQFGLFD